MFFLALVFMFPLIIFSVADSMTLLSSPNIPQGPFSLLFSPLPKYRLLQYTLTCPFKKNYGNVLALRKPPRRAAEWAQEGWHNNKSPHNAMITAEGGPMLAWLGDRPQAACWLPEAQVGVKDKHPGMEACQVIWRLAVVSGLGHPHQAMPSLCTLCLPGRVHRGKNSQGLLQSKLAHTDTHPQKF